MSGINHHSHYVSFPGDDGQDFITVEHCGDDFLVALAESMQDSEDWDDLQTLESEACGTLADMFDKPFLTNYEPDNDGTARNHVHVIEDSPEAQKRQNFVQLDSSSDTEDSDFTIPSKTDVGSARSSCIKYPSNSKVRILLGSFSDFSIPWIMISQLKSHFMGLGNTPSVPKRVSTIHFPQKLRKVEERV